MATVSRRTFGLPYGRLGRLAVTVLLNLALLLAVAGRMVGPTRPVSGVVHGPAGFFIVTVNNWGWDVTGSSIQMPWNIYFALWPENINAFTTEDEHAMVWFAGFYWLKNPAPGSQFFGVEHWLVFLVVLIFVAIHHRRRIYHLLFRSTPDLSTN